MGMLSGLAKGLGEGISKIGEQKREDELLAKKQQAELDRELRIEEAQTRRESRQSEEWTRQHGIVRGETEHDKEIARGEQMTDQQWKLNEELKAKKDQRAYDEPVRNATLQNMSDTHESNQLSQKDAQNKLELQEQITDLNKEFINASPERQDELRPILNAMHGKYEKYAMVNQKTYEHGMVTGEASVPWNTATGELKSREKSQDFNVFNLTSDGKNFKKFSSIDEAVEAASSRLTRYAEKGSPQTGNPVETITELFNSYAPPKDEHGNVINNTEAYISNVEKWTGIDRNEKINLADPEIQKRLLPAIATQEGEKMWRKNKDDILESINKLDDPNRKMKVSMEFGRDENGNIVKVR